MMMKMMLKASMGKNLCYVFCWIANAIIYSAVLFRFFLFQSNQVSSRMKMNAIAHQRMMMMMMIPGGWSPSKGKGDNLHFGVAATEIELEFRNEAATKLHFYVK